MSDAHLEARPGDAPFRNPGWAGNTGEFELTEADVRGDEYVGTLLPDGGHPGAAPALPYILADKDPEAPLFEGPYRERIEKILSRYPTAQAALITRAQHGARAPGAHLRRDDGDGRRHSRTRACVRPGRHLLLHDVQPAPGRALPDPGVHEHLVQPLRGRGGARGLSRGDREPSSARPRPTTSSPSPRSSASRHAGFPRRYRSTPGTSRTSPSGTCPGSSSI